MESLLIGFTIGFLIPITCLFGAAIVAQYINYLQWERKLERNSKQEEDPK